MQRQCVRAIASFRETRQGCPIELHVGAADGVGPKIFSRGYGAIRAISANAQISSRQIRNSKDALYRSASVLSRWHADPDRVPRSFSYKTVRSTKIINALRYKSRSRKSTVHQEHWLLFDDTNRFTSLALASPQMEPDLSRFARNNRESSRCKMLIAGIPCAVIYVSLIARLRRSPSRR